MSKSFKRLNPLLFAVLALVCSPTNRVLVSYSGDEPTLSGIRELTLQDVEPWLKKWGYR